MNEQYPNLKGNNVAKKLIWLLATVTGIIMAALLIAGHVQAADYWLEGKVVGVTDGDTITVLDTGNNQHQVRLFAIDAPETSCHQKTPSTYADDCVERGQAFGKTAKRNLSALVYGKQVSVRLGQGKSYDRVVGTVYVGQQDINLQQVRDGFAWHAKKYAAQQDQKSQLLYSFSEDAARSERRGLWIDDSAIPPWEYRKSLTR
jgi:endonuclease YncB( thermonuclease family)